MLVLPAAQYRTTPPTLTLLIRLIRPAAVSATTPHPGICRPFLPETPGLANG